jgi:ketosteroid isomerase-like protein
MNEARWAVRLFLALALALAVAPMIHAGEAEEAVLEAQDRRFALTTGTGGDFDDLASMMTDDATYTHSSAAVDTKASLLDSLRSGRVRYISIEPEERSVRVYGDAAVIQGIAHVLVKVPDRDIDVRLRFTELYVKQDGQWKMALWHSTTVPD